MKQNFLIGGGTVLGALAAIAVMKMMPSESPVVEKEEDAEVEAAGNAGRRGSKTVSGDEGGVELGSALRRLEGEVAEIDPVELEERRDEFREQMRERQLARLSDKMGKWSAALGLDEAQQGKLLDLADSQFGELEKMEQAVEGSDPAKLSDSARRAMAILSGRALEDSMVEMLTPAQKKKYKEFETGQTQNRAEAGALRQLASLQENLMLTPEQRNDAYGIIYANELAQAEGGSDVSSMISQFASQAGVTLDPALQAMISSAANQGLDQLARGEEISPEGVGEFAQTAMNSSVNEQVELLRPVLTEAQLNLYRSQLEDRFKNIENLIPSVSGGE